MGWKILAIDINDPLAPRLKDINDVERLLPGLVSATKEWFRCVRLLCWSIFMYLTIACMTHLTGYTNFLMVMRKIHWLLVARRGARTIRTPLLAGATRAGPVLPWRTLRTITPTAFIRMMFPHSANHPCRANSLLSVVTMSLLIVCHDTLRRSGPNV